MHLALAARRTIAVAAATALLTSGGVAGGLLSSPALAAVGDPTVSSATPTTANNSNSSPVTINGSGFVPASATVTFRPAFSSTGNGVGPIPASSPDATTSSTTALKVTVPLTLVAPGSYDIVVQQTGASGDATCLKCFTVTSNGPPSLSQVQPGASTGGQSRGAGALDLSGSFLARGATVVFLKPGGASDAGLKFIAKDPNAASGTTQGFPSSDRILGNYSADSTFFSPGRHDIRVTNTDQQSGATVEFWQPVFAAAGVQPSSLGAGSQNQVLTVTGSGIRAGSSLSIQNLATSPDPSDVTVGTSTVSADGTSISAPVSFVSTAKQGTPRSVSINGVDGGAWSVANAFKATAAPAITSFNINTLGQGAVQDILIAGSDFASGGTAGLPTFTFSGSGVTAVTRSVATSAVAGPNGTTTVTTATVAMTVTPGATLGGRSVTVTNPDGGSNTVSPTSLSSPFTVSAGPVGSAVSPASAPAGSTRTVVVSGKDFDATNGMTIVFTQPPVNGAARTSDPAVSVGTVTVTKGTTNANGTTNTLDTASFTLTLAAGAVAGLRDIVLTNKGDFGSSVCAGCFGSDSLSVSPQTAPNTSSAQRLSFNGPVTDGSTVQLVRVGGAAYQPNLQGTSTTVSGSTLTAVFDFTNAAPGPYNAIVTSGARQFSCSSCFTVTGSTPTVTSVTPSAGGQGAVNRATTFTGTKFSRGEQITIAGLNVHDVTFISPTQLTALVDIPLSATTGARDVTITNADGLNPGTLAGGYTVNSAPAVSAASPATLGQGAKQQNVTLTGPGFAEGATVSFGPGITVAKVVVAQGTIIPVLVPNPDDTLIATIDVDENAAANGRDIVVTNPDGGKGTLVNGFMVNAGPKVTSIAPSVLVPGASGKPLIITGSGFSTTSGKTAVPTIAGLTLTNPAVSADGKSLTVTASVDAATAKGVKTVTVSNPTDQGVGTCVSCFAVATVPGAPTGVTAQSTKDQVAVSWLAPVDNGGSPITSYVVSAKGPDGKAAGNTATVGSPPLSATLTGLLPGTTYTVAVIARSAAGDSPAGTALSTTTGTVSIIGPAVQSAPYGSTVPITGLAPAGATVAIFFHRAGQVGYDQRRSLLAAADGTFATSYLPNDDYRYYAQVGSQQSAGVLTQATATVSGPIARTAPRNSTIILSGRAAPNTQIALHFHKAGTPASDYSIVRFVRASSSGTWTRPVELSVDYRYFVTRTGLDEAQSANYLIQGR